MYNLHMQFIQASPSLKIMFSIFEGRKLLVSMPRRDLKYTHVSHYDENLRPRTTIWDNNPSL